MYAVLSDQELRALYDQQGIVDEESTVLTQDRNWEEYWRLLFKKVGSLLQCDGGPYLTTGVIKFVKKALFLLSVGQM